MDLRDFIKSVNEKTPFKGLIKYNEPMFKHTSFRTGGEADVLIRPGKTVFPSWTATMLSEAKSNGIPVFILGGGANLLVSDKGIRGIVLDTGSWRGMVRCNTVGDVCKIKVLSGTIVDNLTDILASRGFSGMEFLAGMPGSVGGAVWMNARCYEKSISDVLMDTEIVDFTNSIDENFNIRVIPFNEKDFSYKKSPFQNKDVLILSATFRLCFRDSLEIKTEMSKYRRDREDKGHYRFPSAGSVFKNNHNFGIPSGKIIDDLGLRGLKKGDAQIAPWHGNIIINTGNASSSDIYYLIGEVKRRVKEEKGFELETEIILVGEW